MAETRLQSCSKEILKEWKEKEKKKKEESKEFLIHVKSVTSPHQVSNKLMN